MLHKNKEKRAKLALYNDMSSFLKSILLLTPLCIGGLCAIYILSSAIEIINEFWPKQFKYFYCCITAISILMFAKKTLTLPIKFKNILSIIFGWMISSIISICIEKYKLTTFIQNPLYLMVSGIIISLAIILPGISFSYMLVFFRLYDKIIYAIHDNDFVFFIPLLIGIFAGCIIFSKIFLRILSDNENTYPFIIGFTFNSLIEIL